MKVNFKRVELNKRHPKREISRWRTIMPIHNMRDCEYGEYSGTSEFDRLFKMYKNSRVTTHVDNKKDTRGVYIEIYFTNVEDEAEFIMRESL